jgi:hypothetical protein
MKNAIFWDAMPCGSCTNQCFGEHSTSIIRVTRIDELGTTLAVTRTNACCEEILCKNGSVSMEYQIEDAERSWGGGGEQVMMWVWKWPKKKARFEASVEGIRSVPRSCSEHF